MARMRTLKPEFWTDSRIVKMSPFARLFYQGCWTFALCDQGHVEDDADSLKLKILPADDVDARELVDELIEHTRLVRKTTADGRTYLHIATLPKHSRLEKRWSSRCEYCAAESTPDPSGPPAGSRDHAESRTSPREPAQPLPRKGKEGKGREGKELTPPLTSFVAPPSEPEAPEADKPKPKPASGPGKGAEVQTGTTKTATRIPDDFQVTPDLVAWARVKAPDADGRRETEKFINYWQSLPGPKAKKLNWPATWRTWMLRAQDDAERANGARASPGALIEHNGLMLGPRNQENVARTERMRALDRKAIEGGGTS